VIVWDRGDYEQGGRVDDEALPGSDVVSEHPRSVVSGATLDELRR